MPWDSCNNISFAYGGLSEEYGSFAYGSCKRNPNRSLGIFPIVYSLISPVFPDYLRCTLDPTEHVSLKKILFIIELIPVVLLSSVCHDGYLEEYGSFAYGGLSEEYGSFAYGSCEGEPKSVVWHFSNRLLVDIAHLSRLPSLAPLTYRNKVILKQIHKRIFS